MTEAIKRPEDIPENVWGEWIQEISVCDHEAILEQIGSYRINNGAFDVTTLEFTDEDDALMRAHTELGGELFMKWIKTPAAHEWMRKQTESYEVY